MPIIAKKSGGTNRRGDLGVYAAAILIVVST
jgi:hypothetical protein